MALAIVLFVVHLTLAISTALVVLRLRAAAYHVRARGKTLYLLWAAGTALLVLAARGLFIASTLLQSDDPAFIGVTEWTLAATGAVTLAMFAGYGRLLIERFDLYRAVDELAAKDSLTGAFNKGTFLTTASPLVLAAQRYRLPLTVVVVTIDQLPRIHDEAGRDVGEQSLRSLGSVLVNSLRKIDVLGRLGGEKFAIVLPHTDLAGASVVVRRLRAAVEHEIEMIYEATAVRLTASVGVAPLHDGNLENLLSDAEGEIYMAEARRAIG